MRSLLTLVSTDARGEIVTLVAKGGHEVIVNVGSYWGP